jgi:hypothetical protein
MQNCRWFQQTILVALLTSGYTPARAQGVKKDQLPPEMHIPHPSGDSVQPVFDGWQQYPDGTISMWFGYYNRNTREEVDVPVGTANSFSTVADKGQPTHFYPKRHQYVFKVDLPRDWDKSSKLIWTLTAHGETCTATGWLQSEWQVDDGVRQMNAGGAGLAPPENNTAPKITSDTPDQTIEFGKSAQLSASATDDGIPKPRGSRGGVGIKWIMYRGPGAVAFKPAEAPPVQGKPVESNTEVTFTEPGSYWLQAIASDSLLESVHNFKVTVKK